MKCKATVGCSCATCEKIRAQYRKAHEAKKRPCSLCKAKPGESCCKPSGVRTLPHSERYAA